MSPKNKIEADLVLLREKIVKDVQAELFNEEKFYREKQVYASRVRADSSSLFKRLSGKSIKTMEEIFMDDETMLHSTPFQNKGGKEIKSMMDDDTAPLSVMSTSHNGDSVDDTLVSDVTPCRVDDETVLRSTPFHYKGGKEIKSMLDDDTAALSAMSTSHYGDSADGSMMSEVKTRRSNCAMPTCRNVKDSEYDKEGLISCVGREVADTSDDLVKLVDGIISLDERLLLKADDFFGHDQVRSLQNTFQDVSTEFDVLTCSGNGLQNMCHDVSTDFVIGCRSSSLVKNLTCNRYALEHEIIEEVGKESFQETRSIELEAVLKEQQPPNKGFLRKLFTRRTKVRFAADAM